MLNSIEKLALPCAKYSRCEQNIEFLILLIILELLMRNLNCY